MQWFRLYNTLRHDPKVQSLRPELFRFWINLLCMASDQDERGTIPSIDAVATDLGMRRDHVERFISSLEASYLLIRSSKDAFRINGWSGRQPLSDDVNRRVKKHRQKTSDEKDGSADADVKRYTGPPCNVLDEIRLEEEKTPLPPTGGTVCVSDPDPGPIPTDGDEPFVPPAVPGAVPRKPPVQNDPAEVQRVADKAERLFPMMDFGPMVQRSSGDVPMALMDVALDEMFKAKKSSWSYLQGIIKRLAASPPGGKTIPFQAQPARRPEPRPAYLEPFVFPEGYKRREPKKPSESTRPPESSEAILARLAPRTGTGA